MGLFLSPFILGAVLGVLLDNLSLALINAGLVILIWGYRPGMNFITLLSISLIYLSGNINQEIIFLYVLSLAYLSQELTKKTGLRQEIFYCLFALISLFLYPFWSSLLGLISAQFLNELNIAGQLLVLTAIVIAFLREKEGGLLRFTWLLGSAVLGIRGEVLALLYWLLGGLAWRLQAGNRPMVSPFFLLGLTVLAAYLLLPLNFGFLLLVVMTAAYLFWSAPELPLLEMVYLAILAGILAGRMGILT